MSQLYGIAVVVCPYLTVHYVLYVTQVEKPLSDLLESLNVLQKKVKKKTLLRKRREVNRATTYLKQYFQ